MLEKLWQAQHPEEQKELIYRQETKNIYTKQTGQQLIDGVVEQSKEIDIRVGK